MNIILIYSFNIQSISKFGLTYHFISIRNALIGLLRYNSLQIFINIIKLFL